MTQVPGDVVTLVVAEDADAVDADLLRGPLPLPAQRDINLFLAVGPAHGAAAAALRNAARRCGRSEPRAGARHGGGEPPARVARAIR